MDQDGDKDWREICKAMVSECDPAKLLRLVTELNRALDRRNEKGKTTRKHLSGENIPTTPLQGEPAV